MAGNFENCAFIKVGKISISLEKRFRKSCSLLGMKGVEYYDIELRKNRDKIEKP